MRRLSSFLYTLCALGTILCVATDTIAAGRGAFAGDSVGARASVMGEAFVAVADDANTLRWNPAGLPMLLQPEVTTSHINFFSLGAYFDYGDSGGVNEDFIGFALPNQIASVGVSFLNLGTSGMLQADERGAVMDSRTSYDERTYTFSLGKGFEFGSLGLAAGWNLNRFSLDGWSSSSGFGMDGGLLLETPGRWPEFGLMMRGLFMDTELGDDGATIPAKTDFAMAFSPWKSLKLAGGLGKTSGGSSTQYSSGLEYAFHWLSPLDISLLAGYRWPGTLENGALESQVTCKSVGFSTRISRYKLDYAYESHSQMGDTHRVTFGILQFSPVRLHMDRGRRAFEQLDDAGALVELEEAACLSPREAEAYHMLALTYERMRMKDEAIQLLEKVQAMDYDYFQERKLGQLIQDIREQ